MKADFATVDLGLKVDVHPYVDSCVQVNFAKTAGDLNCTEMNFVLEDLCVTANHAMSVDLHRAKGDQFPSLYSFLTDLDLD